MESAADMASATKGVNEKAMSILASRLSSSSILCSCLTVVGWWSKWLSDMLAAVSLGSRKRLIVLKKVLLSV